MAPRNFWGGISPSPSQHRWLRQLPPARDAGVSQEQHLPPLRVGTQASKGVPTGHHSVCPSPTMQPVGQAQPASPAHSFAPYILLNPHSPASALCCLAGCICCAVPPPKSLSPHFTPLEGPGEPPPLKTFPGCQHSPAWGTSLHRNHPYLSHFARVLCLSSHAQSGP